MARGEESFPPSTEAKALKPLALTEILRNVPANLGLYRESGKENGSY